MYSTVGDCELAITTFSISSTSFQPRPLIPRYFPAEFTVILLVSVWLFVCAEQLITSTSSKRNFLFLHNQNVFLNFTASLTMIPSVAFSTISLTLSFTLLHSYFFRCFSIFESVSIFLNFETSSVFLLASHL